MMDLSGSGSRLIHTAYLSLGSNMGDRLGNLKEAVRLLRDSRGIFGVRSSSVYETEPVGYEDQEWFLNICLEVRTALDPYELLDTAHFIENGLGRERKIHWGPRTIDIDILLYDDVKNDDPILTLPHPRMTERAFVLIPLSELTDITKLTDNVPEDKSVRRTDDVIPT